MKKRVISLLLVLTLCLGLLPAPVFAEEAPTNQTLAETPVSQNEEPQEEPAPQGQENQQPQPEPAPQDEETPQPQPEPDPQGGETPQPPQEEPEQEEQPVRRVLKANAPMAVAEVGTTLTVGQQEGKLFAGVGGTASFTLSGENVDWTSLKASFGEDVYGLSAEVTGDGTTGTVTVTATGEAKKGTYTLILGEGIATADVAVDVPFAVWGTVETVSSDKTSVTIQVNISVTDGFDGKIQYEWLVNGNGTPLRIRITDSSSVTLYKEDLTRKEQTPSLYREWISCRVSSGIYRQVVGSASVSINTCDHTQPITYGPDGKCVNCKEPCEADKPFITEKGEAIQIPQDAGTTFVLDNYFPGTLYLWENYTTGRVLSVEELNGEGTLELQGYNVGSELILGDFQNRSFTIRNGSLCHLTLMGEAGSLILDDVTIEDSLTVPAGMDLKLNNVTFKDHVFFWGTASINGGTFEAGLYNNGGTCLDILAPGYAFAKDGNVIDASGNEITGKVQVVSHPCTYQDGKCDCGRICDHEGMIDSNTGLCKNCKLQVYRAKVGENMYSTLEEAVSAVETGQTVTLLTDGSLPAEQIHDKDFTLDLNGKTMPTSLDTTGGKILIQDSSQTPGKIESLMAGAGTKISGGSFGEIHVQDPETLKSILADNCYYTDKAGTVISVSETGKVISDVRVARCDHTSVRKIDAGYGKTQYKCNCGQVTYRLTVTVGENDTKYFGDYNEGFAYAAQNDGVVRFLEIVRDKPITVDVHGIVTIDMEEISYSGSYHNWNLVIKSGSTVQLVGQGVVMVIVWVIFPGKVPVCLFYFFICGSAGDAQHLVGIAHIRRLPFVVFFCVLCGRCRSAPPRPLRRVPHTGRFR